MPISGMRLLRDRVRDRVFGTPIGSRSGIIAICYPPMRPLGTNGRGHYAHNGYHGGYNRGRGHWHNGQWIALGVGAAIVGAAAASGNGCYWRNGYRYCD
jgi:hypothetical protein